MPTNFKNKIRSVNLRHYLRNLTYTKMHAQRSRVVKYFAVDFIIICSLYSIHCNCIVLNSTIVTYNYSQHCYDL